MSRQKNNQKLRELYNRKRSAPESLDAFEKEAMEGFDHLESEAEALDIQAGLDKRMSQVLAKPQTGRTRLYWLAAAGLVAFIGFSVYLIRQSAPADLAQKRQPVVVEPKFVPAPVEPAATQAPETEKKEIESPATGVKRSPGKSPESAPVPATAKMAEDEAETETRAEPAITSTKPEPADVRIAAASEQFPPQVKEQNAGAADQDAVAYQNAPASGAENGKSKKQAARAMESRAATAEPSAASSPGGVTAGTLNAAVYKGGQQMLHQHLKEKLQLKKLDQKFDAVLQINNRHQVEKAEITRSFRLKSDEKTAVTDILKSLDQFSLLQPAGADELTEYRLAYRP